MVFRFFLFEKLLIPKNEGSRNSFVYLRSTTPEKIIRAIWINLQPNEIQAVQDIALWDGMEFNFNYHKKMISEPISLRENKYKYFWKKQKILQNYFVNLNKLNLIFCCSRRTGLIILCKKILFGTLIINKNTNFTFLWKFAHKID